MARKRILFYGDSNTWGYNGKDGTRFDEDTRYTGLLAQHFADRYAIVEEGLNSRTTVFQDDLRPHCNGLAYLPVALYTHAPLDLVVFMLGTNDCKRRFGACAQEIARGMELLIHQVRSHSLIREREIPIALILPPPMEEEALLADFMFDRRSLETSRQLPKALEEVAQAYGLPVLDAGKVCRPGRADGVHLDAEGHRKLYEALAQELPRWLGETETQD